MADVMAAGGPWRERVPGTLAFLGRAPGVSRVYLFDVTENAAGRKIVSQLFVLTTINDVLDFSKIEANAMTLEQEPFAVAALLAGVESVVLPLARKQGLGWNIEVEPGAPAGLAGDVARLKQVLINLAANAVKFTHTASVTMRVAVESADLERATLRFEVTDTGVGMTPEQAEKVFETYRQADNGTTRRFGGTGLGLAIAKHLVEAMGGRIAVRTAPGAGRREHLHGLGAVRARAHR